MITLKVLGWLWLLSWFALAAFSIKRLGVRPGCHYALSQLVGTWIATPLGWVILLWPCATHAWTAPIVPSLKPLPGRDKVDQWAGFWRWLNSWAGNREDSASGQQARLNRDGDYVPFMPRPSWLTWKWAVWIWDTLRAYFWSALRNSADELKYVFAYPIAINTSGAWALGRTYLIGFRNENGFNVPVLDL